jgi:hypothetical protein
MDYVSGAFKDTRSAAFTLGVGTVIVTHASIVTGMLPGDWGEFQMQNHAYLNLAAAAAILYGSWIVG